MKKFAMMILIALILVSSLNPISVFATETNGNEGIMLLNNNTLSTSEHFIISDEGIATVSVEYMGYANVTRSATVTVKIQKKVLFWWSDVENGLEDNTWVIYMSGLTGSCIKTLALEDKGSYRAVIEYTITGSGGADDVIPATLYYDYE